MKRFVLCLISIVFYLCVVIKEINASELSSVICILQELNLYKTERQIGGNLHQVTRSEIESAIHSRRNSSANSFLSSHVGKEINDTGNISLVR